jgi:hypothetical protein
MRRSPHTSHTRHLLRADTQGAQPRVVRNAAKHFEIAEVAGDNAYLGRTPQYGNGRGVGRDALHHVQDEHRGTEARFHLGQNVSLFMYNRKAFMFHYHKRSNAESAFSMMKGKCGDAVRSKSEVGQVNEVLARCLCHNVCVLIRAAHELGIEPTFGAGSGVEPKLFL